MKINYFKNKILDTFQFLIGNAEISFSQEGEDFILQQIFEDKKNGTYVDIGSNHPIHFSNTYKLYKSGWNGINVDPNEKTHELFRKYRKNDINIQTAISDTKNIETFFVFNKSELNTLNAEIAEYYRRKGFEYTKTKVNTTTLKEVFDIHISNNKKIDLLSIDVEGNELKVLKSNDWVKYKASYLIIEMTESSFCDKSNTELSIFLDKLGYKLMYKTFRNSIFKSNT